MAAAAPKTLASDSLEVTRSSHLLNIHEPALETQKALSASAILLAARKEKKLARQARNAERARGMGDFEMDDQDHETDEVTGMAEALREADVGMMDVEQDEAVQDKIKVRAKVATGGKKAGGKKESALRRTSGGGMGMGM